MFMQSSLLMRSSSRGETIECDREQMETDSDLIGQLPIIDRPASVVL